MSDPIATPTGEARELLVAFYAQAMRALGDWATDSAVRKDPRPVGATVVLTNVAKQWGLPTVPASRLTRAELEAEGRHHGGLLP